MRKLLWLRENENNLGLIEITFQDEQRRNFHRRYRFPILHGHDFKGYSNEVLNNYVK